MATKTKAADLKALREQPASELRATADTLRHELWQHRLKAKEGALQQTHLIRIARRQVARIQTLLRQQRPSLETRA
jgi:ribosomal protein L29